jgi:hypothetical protein
VHNETFSAIGMRIGNPDYFKFSGRAAYEIRRKPRINVERMPKSALCSDPAFQKLSNEKQK